MPPLPRSRPRWWPDNEPWPPVRGDSAWLARRRRFARRFGLLFGVVLLLAGIGLMSVISALARQSTLPPRWPVFVLVIVILPVFALLAVYVRVMRRIGAPLGDVLAAADRVGRGDFSVRLEETGPRFLRTTAHAFNVMTNRLAAHDAERRRMMADIAHELRTPLSIVQGRLEGLLDGVYPLEPAQLNDLLDQTRALARTVDDLRTLADSESQALTLKREPTDLGLLITDVAGTFSDAAARREITIAADGPPDMPPVSVDPFRIRQVLNNLVDNAVQHTPAGGSITIRTTRTSGGVSIVIADTGSGISPEDLPRIFDRFYKDPASRGSGLGLAIARSLVEAHGGRLTAQSQPGRGTTMTLALPTIPPS